MCRHSLVRSRTPGFRPGDRGFESPWRHLIHARATFARVAQLAEQRFCKPFILGSTPSVGLLVETQDFQKSPARMQITNDETRDAGATESAGAF